jgi:hypothetical protein
MTETERGRIRIPFKTPIILHSKAYHYPQEGELINISMEGAYVKTEDLIPVGYDCEVDILITAPSCRLTISIEGTIVRRDKDGLGIRFNENIASWTLLPLFARYGIGKYTGDEG